MNNFSYFKKTDIVFSHLESLGKLRTFPKNHILVEHDTIPDYCYLICKGKVMGIETLDSGEEFIYSILDNNALFCEANLLARRPVPVSFKVIQDSDILCIDRTSLLMAMENDQQLMTSILNSISTKFIDAMDEVRDIKNHNAIWRLCKLLTDLANRYGVAYDDKVLIHEKISIQTLTSMMGVNRATTVRSLKLLRDLGLVEHINGYYCIRNLDSLKRHQELLEQL